MRLAIAAALVAASVLPASAQTACAPRETIVANLASIYQEARIGFGLSRRGMVIEFFASEQGTWTAVMSGPGGVSCVIDSGTNWEGPKPEKPVKERAT